MTITGKVSDGFHLVHPVIQVQKLLLVVVELILLQCRTLGQKSRYRKIKLMEERLQINATASQKTEVEKVRNTCFGS